MRAYSAAFPKVMKQTMDRGSTTSAMGIPTTVTRSRMKTTGSAMTARIPVRSVMPGRSMSVSPVLATPPGNIRERSM